MAYSENKPTRKDPDQNQGRARAEPGQTQKRLRSDSGQNQERLSKDSKQNPGRPRDTPRKSQVRQIGPGQTQDRTRAEP